MGVVSEAERVRLVSLSCLSSSMMVKTCISSYISAIWREIVYVLVLLLVGSTVVPYLYQNLAYSAFYNPTSLSRTKLMNDNWRRGQQAELFLKKNKLPSLFSHLKTTDVEYCIAIVSVKRPRDARYLTQAVARLVYLLQTLGERHTYSFMVYNPDGDKHTEAVNLSKDVPVLSRKGGEGGGVDSYEKEKQDYVSTLQLCEWRNATYSIILEDDAVVDWMFFPKIEYVLAHWLPTSPSWGMLKLFYPEKYQGWGNDVSMIVELVVVVLLTGLLQTFLVSAVLPGVLWGSRTAPTIAFTLRLVASVGFILFLILTLGRPHWEELRKLHIYLTSVVPARGCCTPAMLYPRAHLTEVIEYLSSVKCNPSFPIDLALDKFVEKKGLGKYLVVPNLVRHIGYLSSLPKGFKNIQEFGLLFVEP